MHIPPLTSRGIATPMHSPWLSFSFLVIRATLPAHFVEPCALGRWVWVCGKAAGSATPSPRNKTLLKLSIYYVCPKPDYNDTTTKKTTVSLLINMRQAQVICSEKRPKCRYIYYLEG